MSEAIQRGDLPAELREAVDSTMADAEHLEINLYEDVPFTQGEAMYMVHGLVGRRLVRMSFTKRQGQERFTEHTEAYSLDDVAKVELGEKTGNVSIRSPEGEFSTGVPLGIARAIIARG